MKGAEEAKGRFISVGTSSELEVQVGQAVIRVAPGGDLREVRRLVNERGARWAAVMYSVIGTCKLNGINPFEYLSDILRRAPALPRSAIDAELTPRAWKAASSSRT